MDSPPCYTTPRPTPKFFHETQTFSTKKERGTPQGRCPPAPRPSTKKLVGSRFQSAKRNISKAMPVSFKSPMKTMTTPLYNENKKESYFEQCFEIICKLGAGSFGEVYKVKSKEDGCFYAIKKSKERFKSSSDRMQKLEEVDKHEKLPVHRNCVKFIKAWEEKNHLYIQTELCKMSLSAYAETHHNIAEKLIWNYLVDLLMAVKHLHDHELIHLDIKPENVFISDLDVCKLGDFGLVLDLSRKKEWMDAQEGDPKYLAPELLAGLFGKAADIFSLGITILELATDLDLPRGEVLWHQLRSGKLPDHLLEGISPELKHIIKWMMEPDPTLRPTTNQILEHQYVNEIWKKRQEEQIIIEQTKPSINLMTPPKVDTAKRFIDWNQNNSDSDCQDEKPSFESSGPLAIPLDLFSSDDDEASTNHKQTCQNKSRSKNGTKNNNNININNHTPINTYQTPNNTFCNHTFSVSVDSDSPTP